ncbi:MAG: PilZ domain-containing protein [Candidatus Omnitrophota bacterium]
MSSAINDENQNLPERRAAIRISCQTPLAFKVCKEETISKIMEGYAQNISSDGLRCTISQEVPVGCTLWLKLDTDALSLCEELDKNAVILQHGILGKVVWLDKVSDDHYDIGLQFITREERE